MTEYTQLSPDYNFSWTAPDSLTNSKTVSAIFKALQPALKMLGISCQKGAIYKRWEELSGTEFDLLAVGWDLNNYNPLWNVEKKKEVLSGCLFEKAKLGTVFAVKKAISIISSASHLEDWFEQQPPAKPYTFRIITEYEKLDIELNEQTIKELSEYVNYSKPARCLWSWDITAFAKNELKIVGPYGHCQIYRRIDQQDQATSSFNEILISPKICKGYVFARL